MKIVKPAVSLIEEKAMSLSIFHYCIYDFPCWCCNFNPILCRLSPFLLFYVADSRPCRCRYFLLYLPFSLPQFQPIFVSFVAISVVLCQCFKAITPVGITSNRASG